MVCQLPRLIKAADAARALGGISVFKVKRLPVRSIQIGRFTFLYLDDLEALFGASTAQRDQTDDPRAA